MQPVEVIKELKKGAVIVNFIPDHCDEHNEFLLKLDNDWIDISEKSFKALRKRKTIVYVGSTPKNNLVYELHEKLR